MSKNNDSHTDKHSFCDEPFQKIPEFSPILNSILQISATIALRNRLPPTSANLLLRACRKVTTLSIPMQFLNMWHKKDPIHDYIDEYGTQGLWSAKLAERNAQLRVQNWQQKIQEHNPECYLPDSLIRYLIESIQNITAIAQSTEILNELPTLPLTPDVKSLESWVKIQQDYAEHWRTIQKAQKEPVTTQQTANENQYPINDRIDYLAKEATKKWTDQYDPTGRYIPGSLQKLSENSIHSELWRLCIEKHECNLPSKHTANSADWVHRVIEHTTPPNLLPNPLKDSIPQDWHNAIQKTSSNEISKFK
jgi:hypothetical protein